MADEPRMTVILCWHMHQPEYRDAARGEFRFPWTLLHAVKDYVDMAAHLEAEPRVRAVVNFAPVLLEQIADYVGRLSRHYENGAPLGELLLDALAFGPPVRASARAALIRQCLRANRRRVIARYPAWERLVRMLEPLGEDEAAFDYLSDRFITDLLVWYWIGWIAETERRGNALIADLVARGGGFTAADRRALLQLLRQMLATLLARWRDLAERGQVELAMSPYAHPILPLLLDLQCAREALPEAPLPQAECYPGGEERARWQLRHGREVFRAHFGREPEGCWPSEGALSTATVRLLAEEGFRWCASGESVLRNSRAAAQVEGDEHACRHRVYRIDEAPIDCFFRDDGLSDLIGFSYADWHAEDAVANLVHHMENIASACPDRKNCALTVILDGENAWEYYPENAVHFLSGLYRALADHPQLITGTFGSFLDTHRPEPARLPRVVAGSWVYGTLSTWIGSADKNRGWELLIEAKQAFDRVLAAGRLDATQRAAAERQLAVCEGSDWFWWFGDYNPAQAVSDFEQLYRRQLASLYRLLDEAAPEHLEESFTRGGGDAPHGGTMRASTDAR